MKTFSKFRSLLAVPVLALSVMGCARAEETAKPLPIATLDAKATGATETAVLAGGCFWGIQGVFQHVKGVSQVWSGYSGGAKPAEGYESVSSGATGHAESVKIVFDPKQVSYGQLLRIYFSVMDPTELNFQTPDEGTQYRSNIFATTPDQKRVADAYIAQLSKAHAFSKPIVTRVDMFKAFYPAEDYHQDYLIHHPDQPYIAAYDMPKVGKLKALYPALYRDKPVMVFASRS